VWVTSGRGRRGQSGEPTQAHPGWARRRLPRRLGCGRRSNPPAPGTRSAPTTAALAPPMPHCRSIAGSKHYSDGMATAQSNPGISSRPTIHFPPAESRANHRFLSRTPIVEEVVAREPDLDYRLVARTHTDAQVAAIAASIGVGDAGSEAERGGINFSRQVSAHLGDRSPAMAATWASVWVRAFLAYGISRSIAQRSTLSAGHGL
jgi:hypothetical protein